MNKIKEEVDDGLLVPSDNFTEAVQTIKKEVDENEEVAVPMQLISYSSEQHSPDTDDTHDEYEIVVKVEPELEISDDIQCEITDDSNAIQKYECISCEFRTNRKYYLDIHIEMMHSPDKYSDDPDELSCPHCDYKANNKLNVKRHLVANHLGGERRYSCYICDFKTHNLLSLQSHRACHRSPVSYSCPHCATFSCKQLVTMREHERKHLVQMSCQQLLFCAHCDYRTYFKYSLKMHSKVHLSEKPDDAVPIHSCSLCDFRTKRLRVLKVHHRRIHLGEEPFRCPVCKHAYSTNGSLMRHLKTHSKEEHSIKCTECDYKTLQYSSLKGHMKTHSKHPQPHKCTDCDYRTTRKVVLQSHMKIHRTSYTCTQCNFKTHRKTVFKQHECLSTAHTEGRA